MDRLGPDAPRQPRPQWRRHSHDQGGRPQSPDVPSCGWRRARRRLPTLGELDVHPKDGKVSIDELAEALRPILGPFRLQVGRQAIGRTDALFDQLDRDKDGELTRSELAAIAGSLRPLDLDDNEMISADELEPFDSPAFAAMVEESSERRARFTALPPVVELVAGESSLRPARLLLKKYDKGKGDVPGRPDNKLSPGEFAIDPDVFASADTNGDDALDTDELRKLLARTPIDLTLDVTLSRRGVGPGDGPGGSRQGPAQGNPGPAARRRRRRVRHRTGTARHPRRRRKHRGPAGPPHPPAAVQGRRRQQGRLPRRQGTDRDQCPTIAPCRSLGGHRPRRRRQDLPEGADRVRRSPSRGRALRAWS